MRCAHCGLPVQRAARVEADEPRFCCVGCHLAHHLSGDVLSGRPDRLLGRLVLSAVLAMGVMVFTLSLYGDFLAEDGSGSEAAEALRGLFRLGALALSAPVVLLLGAPLLEAVVATRRWLSSDSLILSGAGAAWGLSIWNTWTGEGQVYFETTTAVLVLVTLGKWLDARSRERARSALGVLTEECVSPVALVSQGCEHSIAPDQLRVGDRFRLHPGEEVPVDGEVLEGRSFVDTSALTGEEQPCSFGPGNSVLAGAYLVDGTLLVRATAVHGSRVRDEIERRLVEAAASRPQHVQLADRVAAGLLPFVGVLAVGTAAWHWSSAGPEQALLHALAVVLVSCPCALGIATPYAFWVALGEAWRRGALVRGSDVLERLARVRRVFLDKTGTLTTGAMELCAMRVLDNSWTEEQALRAAASLECGSEHPIGRALRSAWSGDAPPVTDFEALPGIGVCGVVEGVRLSARRSERGEAERTVVSLFAGETAVAEFELCGQLRREAPGAVAELERAGLLPTILTGDGPGAARAAARELGIPAEAELLPGDKVERILAAGPLGTVFVGDGLNDSAAMSAADVAVSMPTGARPSLDAAGVALIRGDLSTLPWLLDLSHRAVRVARANLAWAFAYNTVGLWLAASGRLSPIFAASAMVVSSVLVVLNSGRLREPEDGAASRRTHGREGYAAAPDSAQAEPV